MIVRKDGTEKSAKVDTLGELVEYGQEFAEGKAGYLKDPKEYVPETTGNYAGVADARAKEAVAGELYSGGNVKDILLGKSATVTNAVREARKANEKALEEGPTAEFRPSLAESTYGADYASDVRERDAARKAASDAQSGQDLQEAKAARREARARAERSSSNSRDMSMGNAGVKTVSREMGNPSLGA